MQDVVSDLFEKLINELNIELEDLKFKSNIILLIYYIVFIMITCIIFMLYVFPLAEDLKNKFIVTIKLLNIIPTTVISKINSISNYLKNN